MCKNKINRQLTGHFIPHPNFLCQHFPPAENHTEVFSCRLNIYLKNQKLKPKLNSVFLKILLFKFFFLLHSRLGPPSSHPPKRSSKHDFSSLSYFSIILGTGLLALFLYQSSQLPTRTAIIYHLSV